MSFKICFIKQSFIKPNSGADSSEHVLETEAKIVSEQSKGKRLEDNIPVIEIRGEGKPMSSAQIRELEEAANGAPLDIKIEKTWRPAKCPHAAKRKDFVTFHYKAFTEAGKKYDQTYGREPIRMQLGVGMTMPGMDKGLRGMCDTELRKLHIPYRLSRKKKSRVWKNILNEEHWLVFNIEMLTVEPWSISRQFQYFDLNNDTFLTMNELVKFQEKMKKDFGKTWSNQDIDQVIAAKYYIKYFDANDDQKIDLNEFRAVTSRDMKTMAAKSNETKPKGRLRDPGIAWILDFNNDGIVTIEENNEADEKLQHTPTILPKFTKDEL
uniref:peptidylprolyl isomerase n=1 Tax=Syphacia muris TaxID=451379 RepID=A0A0N5ARS2_9BILA